MSHCQKFYYTTHILQSLKYVTLDVISTKLILFFPILCTTKSVITMEELLSDIIIKCTYLNNSWIDIKFHEIR